VIYSMIKLDHILCPTDLSDDSERTLRYAVALARASGAKLSVCHRAKSPAEHEEALQTMQKLVTAGEAFPTGATEDAASSVDWESELLEGSDLGTIITREAELRRADLIFMRSRRRPFAAALLGSTAEAVSRLAPCPVLVMHADEREWLDSTLFGSNVDRVLRQARCPVLIAHPLRWAQDKGASA
jgi:nucleotide-binding universal stress UspA family protein